MHHYNNPGGESIAMFVVFFIGFFVGMAALVVLAALSFADTRRRGNVGGRANRADTHMDSIHVD